MPTVSKKNGGAIGRDFRDGGGYRSVHLVKVTFRDLGLREDTMLVTNLILNVRVGFGSAPRPATAQDNNVQARLNFLNSL